MKILYLTFYFEPDLSAGSFRNTTLAKELSKQSLEEHEIEIITTKPNRYSTFKADAKHEQNFDNVKVYRVDLSSHKSGMVDQILSFKKYYQTTMQIAKNKKYDLVFVSSSRLFTAFLGYRIAKKQKIPLYLDIRDIFVDTMQEVLKNRIVKAMVIPVLKQIEHRVFSYATHINLISEGFKTYFSKYNKAKFSYFTNGIDNVFLENVPENREKVKYSSVYTIVYAGNIGKGQGLHKVIPQAAFKLGDNYQFVIVGDGGEKDLLLEEIKNRNLTNVEFNSPVSREKLIQLYNNSDYLFLHLNDYKAFEKVLPSKVFELATFNKPIIAGVGGYAYNFIQKNIKNKILFKPCDVNDFVEKIKNYDYKIIERREFKEKFSRSTINKKMAKSILSYLK